MATRAQKVVSSNRLTSNELLTESDLTLLIPMLRDVFRNRTGLLEDRNYGLGERNKRTLPGAQKDSESEHDNARKSRSWASLRKWVASVNSAGVRY